MGIMAELHKADREQCERKGIEIFQDLTIYRDYKGKKPIVKIWSGKRSAPFAHYSFQSEEKAETFIEAQRSFAQESAKHKAERKALKEKAKTQFKNPFKLGDIIHHSWGYDQTQCDYYQVVKTTKATVTLKPIMSEVVPGSEGFMCQNEVPVKDAFCEAHCALKRYSGKVKEITKTVKGSCNDKGDMSYWIPTPFGYASLWNGKPNYHSWYA